MISHKLDSNESKSKMLYFQRFWASNNQVNNLMFSERHMYGEATSGSLLKIWMALDTVLHLRADDVLADWGMGNGKMLLSKLAFSPFPAMHAIGVEIDKNVFANAQYNISRVHKWYKDTGTIATQLGDSAQIVDWSPATIVMQYDGGGGSVNSVESYHRTIMQNLVHNSKTVRGIFSTKMTRRLFDHYFPEAAVRLQWKMVSVKGLRFGNSYYTGHLWYKEDHTNNKIG